MGLLMVLCPWRLSAWLLLHPQSDVGRQRPIGAINMIAKRRSKLCVNLCLRFIVIKYYFVFILVIWCFLDFLDFFDD